MNRKDFFVSVSAILGGLGFAKVIERLPEVGKQEGVNLAHSHQIPPSVRHDHSISVSNPYHTHSTPRQDQLILCRKVKATGFSNLELPVGVMYWFGEVPYGWERVEKP